MKFFNHIEGYIEPDGAGGYRYIYQYKDYWDNTRITYSDDDGNGLIDFSEIRREQNYYPFGLVHLGYNNSSYGVKNNLKTYQGQEFTEDLGLNTHEWRYRVSDPAIGRFWQIDPLSEDYVYNSTYAFQENKMGMGIELEGLELVSPVFGVSNTPLLSNSSEILVMSDSGKMIRLTAETGKKTAETTTRLSRNASKGKATETKQLAKNGLEKKQYPDGSYRPKNR